MLTLASSSCWLLMITTSPHQPHHTTSPRTLLAVDGRSCSGQAKADGFFFFQCIFLSFLPIARPCSLSKPAPLSARPFFALFAAADSGDCPPFDSIRLYLTLPPHRPRVNWYLGFAFFSTLLSLVTYQSTSMFPFAASPPPRSTHHPLVPSLSFLSAGVTSTTICYGPHGRRLSRCYLS